MTRFGSKGKPFYRIVVVDSRKRRDGKFIEQLGYYDPMTDPAKVKLDVERMQYWLDHGGIPTTTVRRLFNRVKASPSSAVGAGS